MKKKLAVLLILAFIVSLFPSLPASAAYKPVLVVDGSGMSIRDLGPSYKKPTAYSVERSAPDQAHVEWVSMQIHSKIANPYVEGARYKTMWFNFTFLDDKKNPIVDPKTGKPVQAVCFYGYDSARQKYMQHMYKVIDSNKSLHYDRHYAAEFVFKRAL
ncbi:hypothetical protein SAMN02745221_02203 [Thermosyntropha lipolytica DSM 11003]|uniref:Uncharacterized protein n=1 Tax=Thermosyntropha lipolytica DSM 11003 TaxID=1123382 RepID=A0A1M5SCP0_9FIRM|nr:hypothetical protein [Thermosyntropha lipolytica]SHH36231.1 hypothetical protein SAMN02745221_02203 [Thermosyntropha lipolytica DSM 11003]